MTKLVNPHGGGPLKPLLLTGPDCAAELQRAASLPKIPVSSREKGDLLMLGIGGFTPLDGFMNHADWRGVCDHYTLANGVWLGADVAGIAQWFLDHQQADGGWNCEWVNGSTRSSFHSTLNTLKGLLAYEAATGGSKALEAARRAGEDYLLERRLMRRLSTGEVVAPWVTRLAYPFRWCYSVLNAAEYFRLAALNDGTAPDPRLADAIAVIRDRRRPDGSWLQEHRLPGRAWFEVDAPPGEPSRWLTCAGTRVLAWWDEANGAARS